MRFAFKQASMVIDESAMKKNAVDKNPKLSVMQLEGILSGFPYMVFPEQGKLLEQREGRSRNDDEELCGWKIQKCINSSDRKF